MTIFPYKILRRARYGLIGGAALLLLAAAGYKTGLLETLGIESKTLSAGRGTTSENGYSLGISSLYLSHGTSVFVKYDAEVQSGSLIISLMKSWGQIGKKPHFRHRVEQSGQGEIQFHVTQPGWYNLLIDGSVLGKTAGPGYQVSYSLRWGIR